MKGPLMCFVDDFLRGQIDADKGLPHQAGKSEAYDRGYAAQYEAEQIASEQYRRVMQ
jgi:hypothetical protein